MNSWDDKNFVAAIEKTAARRSFWPDFGQKSVLRFPRCRRFKTVTKSTSWKTAAAT